MSSKHFLLLTITKTCANWWHFSSARGYAVLEAPTARMAIHGAIEGNPNLILLDLRFPDMNGIEVARQLQKIPETTHIPVTAWTADYRASRIAGLFDCIQKTGFVARTRGYRCTLPISLSDDP